MTPRLSSALDASRWAAAGLVVISHIRNLLFVDYAHLTHPTLLTKAFYAVTGLGHEAVVIFFVISGYLVGGLSLARPSPRGFELRRYAAARFSRIYTVLVPALILGGGLDCLGMTLANHTGIYTNPAPFKIISLPFAVADQLNLRDFAGSLLMVENILTRQFGSNGPLWSLAYEWWYYCLFAAAACLGLKRGWAAKALSAAAIALMVWLLPYPLLAWGSIWCLGLLLALYQARRWPAPPLWLGLLLFLATLALSRYLQAMVVESRGVGLVALGRDAALALGYISLLASLRDGKALPLAGLHQRLANFSYSIYLTHYPFVLFCIALACDVAGLKFAQQINPAGMAVFGALLALTYGFAFAVARLTEAHTGAVRTAIQRLLGAHRPPTTAPVAATD